MQMVFGMARGRMNVLAIAFLVGLIVPVLISAAGMLIPGAFSIGTLIFMVAVPPSWFLASDQVLMPVNAITYVLITLIFLMIRDRVGPSPAVSDGEN